MASCVIYAAADEDERPITHMSKDVISLNKNCNLGSFAKLKKMTAGRSYLCNTANK